MLDFGSRLQTCFTWNNIGRATATFLVHFGAWRVLRRTTGGTNPTSTRDRENPMNRCSLNADLSRLFHVERRVGVCSRASWYAGISVTRPPRCDSSKWNAYLRLVGIRRVLAARAKRSVGSHELSADDFCPCKLLIYSTLSDHFYIS